MIDDKALGLLFNDARTANGWLAGEVSDAQLRRIFDLMKMGPTAANSQPARCLLLRSAAAKAPLRPALSPTNTDKTMSAPAVALIAYDTLFHEHLPKIFPHNPAARNWFEGDAVRAARETSAFRNGTLQGAYFIIAARAAGLDCGPMSGFDAAKVDAEFFPDGRFRTNFLCNLGHGDPSKTYSRSPRFAFEDVCQVL
ncbi:MAG: malonic semialdehyde reductase [Betaproteobacteria bacterium]